jgi:hypothetical protein
MSALGQKQTFATAPAHVRFTPESGHLRCTTRCLLWAKSGLMQCSLQPHHSSTSSANASGVAGAHSEAAMVPYPLSDQSSFEHLHTRYTHCECHTAEALAKSFGQTVTNSFLRHWTMIGTNSVLRPF